MIVLFRRHLASCKHADKGRKYRACNCPIAAEGRLSGAYIRKTLDVRGWEAANKIVREWEVNGVKDIPLVKDATQKFLDDCDARKLKPLTIKKYKVVKGVLDKEFGELPVSKIEAHDLVKFRKTWKISGWSSRRRIEHIRTFFEFWKNMGWIESNPAKSVKSAKIERNPTLPFTDEEWKKILWAVDAYREIHPLTPEATQRKLKALVLLMRYSGLRISDAVALRKDRIDGSGRLLVRQEKTGNPVMVPLPKLVLDALEQADDGDGCYFWGGVGKLNTSLTKWHERMKKMFTISGVSDAHSHRFRDSFAVDLLSKGVDIQTVSVLLGHQSVKTTEIYYNPWVRSRQELLERAVKGTWESLDAVATSKE